MEEGATSESIQVSNIQNPRNFILLWSLGATKKFTSLLGLWSIIKINLKKKILMQTCQWQKPFSNDWHYSILQKKKTQNMKPIDEKLPIYRMPISIIHSLSPLIIILLKANEPITIVWKQNKKTIQSFYGFMLSFY